MPEHRTAAGQPPLDQLGAARRRAARPCTRRRRRRPGPRARRSQRRVAVGGERDVGAGPLQRPHRRADVARSVVEHDDRRDGSCRLRQVPAARRRPRQRRRARRARRPSPDLRLALLVAASTTPPTQEAGDDEAARTVEQPSATARPWSTGRLHSRVGATASRSARATALNWASTTWWALRPASTRTCRRDLRRRRRSTPRCAGSATCRTCRSARRPRGSACTTYGRPDRSTAACTRASSSGTSASPKRRMPALSPSASRSAWPTASAVSSTVWCASTSRSPAVRTVRSKPPCLPSWAEHVVEERHAGLDVGRAGAVEVELDEDVGLLGGALDACGAAHAVDLLTHSGRPRSAGRVRKAVGSPPGCRR